MILLGKTTGYMGKILRVNLSSGDIKIEDLDLDFARDYVGGSGFGIRYIYDEVPPETDALSEQNKICFFTGPLVGTPSPSTGRYMVAAKSPLTNIFGEACSGGFWGPELKFSGFDGIIVEGTAETPKYLWIHDGEVELKNASSLWGKDTFETEVQIQKELGDKKIRTASIGPAGEKLIKMAAIINDMGRAAGRTGIGAVMGSKKLKAIACRGFSKIEIADETLLKKASKSLYSKMNMSPMVNILKSYGTATFLDAFWVLGDIPFKNWGASVHDWADNKGIEPFILTNRLAGSSLRDKYKKRLYACHGCSIACGCEIEVDEGPYKGIKGHAPEYETLAMFGTNCLNDNLESICKTNDICNRYGMDTISVGGTISFAMDLYEKGIITKEDTGGLELTWGNADAIVKLTELIAKNEGFGEVLAEGVRRAAEKIGRNSADYAIHVKGLEVPAHDPRAFVSMGVQYATSNRGACHVNGLPSSVSQGMILPLLGISYKTSRFVNKGKGIIDKKIQEVHAIFNSIIVCQFAALVYGSTDTCRLLKATAGFDYDFEDLIYKCGGRINTLKRLYNIRCGISAKDDILPKKLLTPLKTGSTANVVPDLETQLQEYYRENKWDSNGYPTEERLKELGLEKELKYVQ